MLPILVIRILNFHINLSAERERHTHTERHTHRETTYAFCGIKVVVCFKKIVAHQSWQTI